jgi:hypothetical protein
VRPVALAHDPSSGKQISFHCHPGPDRNGVTWNVLAYARLGVFLLAFAAAGCPGNVDPSLLPRGGGGGGTGNSGGGGGGTQVCDPAPIFAARNCALAGCHDAAGSSANFDMMTPGWQTQLVGVTPEGGGSLPSKCVDSGPYLVPGSNPAAGLFMQKLNADAPAACGDLMPLVGTRLSAADLDCVQSWANALVMGGSASDGGGQ